MNNEKHPIDDLFQRGLNQHTVPPPMHVWERIEDSRGSHHRGKLVLLRQRVTIVSSAAAVLLLVWLGWPESPHLGSFPLLTSGNKAVADQEIQAEPPLELPTQQAGLVPPVQDMIKKDKKQSPAATSRIAAVTVLEEATEQQLKGIDQTNVPGSPDAPKIPAIASAEANGKAQEITASASLTQLESPATKSLSTPLTKLEFTPLQIPETGCARFSEGRPAIFLAVTGGPSLAQRTFSARSEEYLEYAQQRSNTESTRLSYGASARLSIVFPWGGAIRSGIGYTQLNEQLVYRNSKVRQTTITEIYGPNGEVIGTDTSFITENTILKYNNQHRLIDIPLQLGYEVRYNKVTLAANAGVNLNVAYANKGSYLGPRNLLPTRFDNDDPNVEPIYKTKVGMSWQASLGLHYQLNDHLDLMAEPYLRYYPDSFTLNDYPLSQKYLVGGIGVGLRVLL